MKETIEIRRVKDHVEVYCGDDFLFSADTVQEAEQELKEGDD